MKLSLRKSFRAIMKGCLTLASAFVIISVNSTCMGPGYQPRIPDTANRFKRNHSRKQAFLSFGFGYIQVLSPAPMFLYIFGLWIIFSLIFLPGEHFSFQALCLIAFRDVCCSLFFICLCASMLVGFTPKQKSVAISYQHLHFFLSYSILRIQLFIFTTWYFPAYQPA